ncbi:hypothetical protein C922_05205 [Plasmodium inui San Antonio 1]|uniref:Uncharacterized protein n=1 Tax=Plasmodium inui San Antonio 1 TaxID=1237626 RepID=W7AGG9_9APIC|nr:hypothetical protein C922_05205 [Plasmodium inui San Antonio 1]EUD64406.1 hypothetical protein C922_05205 [Plasmodium inui San Antonio 1]
MLRFSGWIEEGIWRRKQETDTAESPPTRLRLKQLEQGTAKQEQQIPRDRWDSPLEGVKSSLKGMDMRSRLICQAIEVWMQNLQIDKNEKWEQKESSCQKEEVGFLFPGWREDKCPINRKNNQWSRLTRDISLMRSQAYHRNLAVCMDMMSIILTAYQNIERETSSWTLQGKDACEAIYDAFTTWGGKAVAEEVMSEWFNNPPKGTSRRRSLKVSEGNKARGEIWAEFFKEAGSYVTALQCYKNPAEANRWRTTCLRTRNNEGCEQMQGDVQQYEEKRAEESLRRIFVPQSGHGRVSRINKPPLAYFERGRQGYTSCLTTIVATGDNNEYSVSGF